MKKKFNSANQHDQKMMEFMRNIKIGDVERAVEHLRNSDMDPATQEKIIKIVYSALENAQLAKQLGWL